MWTKNQWSDRLCLHEGFAIAICTCERNQCIFIMFARMFTDLLQVLRFGFDLNHRWSLPLPWLVERRQIGTRGGLDGWNTNEKPEMGIGVQLIRLGGGMGFQVTWKTWAGPKSTGNALFFIESSIVLNVSWEIYKQAHCPTSAQMMVGYADYLQNWFCQVSKCCNMSSKVLQYAQPCFGANRHMYQYSETRSIRRLCLNSVYLSPTKRQIPYIPGGDTYILHTLYICIPFFFGDTRTCRLRGCHIALDPFPCLLHCQAVRRRPKSECCVGVTSSGYRGSVSKQGWSATQVGEVL